MYCVNRFNPWKTPLRIVLEPPHPGPIEIEFSATGVVQKGLDCMVFCTGYLLGYTDAFLRHSFLVPMVWALVRAFLCIGAGFLFVFLLNRYIDHRAEAEKQVVEEEERRRDIPPRADSAIYY
jgi:hypothetical protein